MNFEEALSVSVLPGERLHFTFPENIQHRRPNFKKNGKFYLMHCFVCGHENYGPAVATGQCSFCGWKESHDS